MLAIILIYNDEVLRLYNYAEDAGVAHAQMEAAEQLHSATKAVEVVQAALAGGFLTNLSDFDTLHHIMRPVFDLSRGALREVEIAGPPDSPPGSILVMPTPDGKNVSLMSDRDDCEKIGKFGCSSAPLSAATGQWYKDAYGIDRLWSFVPKDASWVGPVFIRSNQFVSICNDLCWIPAFTFVGRAKREGSTKAQIEGLLSTDPLPERPSVDLDGNPVLNIVVVRAVLSASILQNVALTAARVTKGKAVVATATGDVVAAEDMASAVTMDDETGLLKTRKVWTIENDWFKAIEEPMVAQGERVSKTIDSGGGAIITARKVEGPGNDALAIGQILRLVLGTPFSEYTEPTLSSIQIMSIASACVPGGIMVLCMCVALYLRYRSQSQKGAEDAKGFNRGPKSPSSLSGSLSRTLGSVKKFASNRQLALSPKGGFGGAALKPFRFLKRTKSFTLKSAKPEAVPGSSEMMQLELDGQFGGKRSSMAGSLAIPD